MDRCELIAVARGDTPADLALRGGTLVNVLTGELESVDVAVAGGVIASIGPGYNAADEVDCSGSFICPGLIDPHLHLESSLLTLPEFARAVLPHGTTTVVLDPHEIANVLGIEGVRYLLQSRREIPLNVFVTAPSCVPATDMETAGATLSGAELELLYAEEGVLGLGEMMNFPGVLQCNSEVMQKIAGAAARGLTVDGHGPGLLGHALNAYLAAGIDSDHECTRPEEALEKLRRGMYVFLREGSGARNIADLAQAVTERNNRRCCLCTDDRHPGDLLAEGHMDNCIRRAVAAGVDPVVAVQMATINPAERFGLDRRGYGTMAIGARADLVVVNSLQDFYVTRTFIAGEQVACDGETTADVAASKSPLPRSMNIGWQHFPGLAVPAPAKKQHLRVITVTDGQLLTGHTVMAAAVKDGLAVADPARDLLKLAVIERHRGTGNTGIGFVHGFGLTRGAMATSVAHDSHNIIVVGTNDEEMLAAVRAVEEAGGGQAVVADRQVQALLPLPIAGLISDLPVREAAQAERAVTTAAQALGCRLAAPLMTLSFLALPVIPSLKLTDKGLVDVENFTFTNLWAD